MGYSMLLAERLGLQIGLNDETARNASPGKMTDLMNARSGIPPESETAPLPERQKVFKENLKQSVLVVYPVRINIKADKDAAEGLVKKINGAGLCRAKLSKEPLLLETPQQDPNELKKLWDLARDFRNYARGKPADADYVLYADYAMPGYVHFVVCDRSGEWVIADFQNSNHPDFRNYNTATVDGCNNLAVTRLQRYTKTSVADAVREAINSSGTDAGYDLFKNVRSKEGYFMSEDEMNNLGYQYMYARKLPEAIAVFKMNVEAFPDSWNPYDSLGEAYAAAGEKELAIENYEKSLKLNPDSPTGKEALKKLKPK
jgi:tetratricopeptide (TPR) repeat protein